MMKNQLTFLVLFFVQGFVGGDFDFYIDPEQTRILYGVDTSGIYYVKKGVVNQYAMTFQNQIIPASIDELIFHWSKEKGQKISYSINLVHTPGPAMDRPILNISSTGIIPTEDSAFSVRLPCTGKTSGQIDFLIQIKLIHIDKKSKGETLLNFKRRKVCLEKGKDHQGQGEVDGQSQGGGRRQQLSASTSTAIALGSAAAAVVLLFILLAFMYMTRNRRVPNVQCSSLAHLHYVSAVSSAAAAAASGASANNYYKNGNFKTGPNAHYNNYFDQYQQSGLSLSRLSSYATLASFTNVPMNAPIPTTTDNNATYYQNQQQRKIKSMSLNYRRPPSFHQYQHQHQHQQQQQPRGSGEDSRRLLHNSSSSSTSTGSNSRSRVMMISDQSSSTTARGSLVLEDGMLRISRPLPAISTKQQQQQPVKKSSTSSTSSSSSSSISSSSRHRMVPVKPSRRNRQQRNLLIEDLGLNLTEENEYKDFVVEPQNNVPVMNNGDCPYYVPHVYPHLMPHNFAHAQNRAVPRSSSRGSVLV